jgi:hypothetical protein
MAFGMRFGKGELGGSVDCDEEIEPAFAICASAMSMWK